MNFIHNIDYMFFLNIAGKYALNFVFSILIFFVGRWAIGRISIIVDKILKKSKIDPLLAYFISNCVKTFLFIFVILAALSNLGIETTSFVAVLGAVGLAIGMAFKDTFGNVGAGVLIIFFRPFKMGDLVEIAGTAGVIDSMNLFSTFLKTGDDKIVIIPNSQVISGKIINYSLTPTRRIDLTFGIDYKDDIRLAKEIILKIANENPLVLKEPGPFVGVINLGDNSVDLMAKIWVNNGDYWVVYHSMLEKVKIAFDEAGISIPFPQLVTHHIYDNKE